MGVMLQRMATVRLTAVPALVLAIPMRRKACRRTAALYRRDRVAFFAAFFGSFFAAFFGTAFLAGDFLAADFFAAFFVGVVLAAFFTAFFASFLAGDFFKASATEPIAVLTVPATSSAIARPYPTFSAAFSTNVLFAIFGPPAFMFVRSHEL
jgi:hypothetical protein